MEINKVYNLDFLANDLPDKCAKLIIADPPYYKVKGDFDFIWKTFDDYLVDVEKWAVECKRLLADNGTLFWYGDAKNIAYSQIIFDKHFNLLNSIVWENTNDHKQQIRFNEDLRSFAPLTERILMYSNKIDDKIFEDMYHETIRKSIEPTHKYLNSITNRDELANKLLNNGNCKNIASAKQNANNILKQTSAKPQFITELQYNLIGNDNKKPYIELRKEYEELRKEYEVLRKKHEALRRPFNNYLHLGDVIRLPNYETSTFDHDTIKPEKLTRMFITTCTSENDLVVVPFAGSGTECAMSVKEKRNFVGYEITEKHAEMSNKRVYTYLTTPTMF